jgi:hypothetical protein
MQFDNSRVFAFNFSDDFSIEDTDKNFNTSNPEHLYEFSKGIGLKNAEKYLFPCFLQKMQMALPKTKTFSN